MGVPALIFEEAEYEKIRRIFRETAPYLDEIRIPRLVHTDLWFGNILVSTADGAPRLAAIIDADRALWGDPYFEFFFHLLESQLRQLLGGIRKPTADG